MESEKNFSLLELSKRKWNSKKVCTVDNETDNERKHGFINVMQQLLFVMIGATCYSYQSSISTWKLFNSTNVWIDVFYVCTKRYFGTDLKHSLILNGVGDNVLFSSF